MNTKYASRHFLWREFYCPTAQVVPVSDLTLYHVERLERLRQELDKPLRVNSGYRSPDHNAKVGGAKASMHLEFATDIAPTGELSPEILQEIYTMADEFGFSGLGKYDTFIHLDCRDFIGRTPARWDYRKAAENT